MATAVVGDHFRGSYWQLMDTHAWEERGERGEFSWLQSTTSPLEATKSYPLHF